MSDNKIDGEQDRDLIVPIETGEIKVGKDAPPVTPKTQPTFHPVSIPDAIKDQLGELLRKILPINKDSKIADFEIGKIEMDENGTDATGETISDFKDAFFPKDLPYPAIVAPYIAETLLPLLVEFLLFKDKWCNRAMKVREKIDRILYEDLRLYDLQLIDTASTVPDMTEQQVQTTQDVGGGIYYAYQHALQNISQEIKELLQDRGYVFDVRLFIVQRQKDDEAETPYYIELQLESDDEEYQFIVNVCHPDHYDAMNVGNVPSDLKSQLKDLAEQIAVALSIDDAKNREYFAAINRISTKIYLLLGLYQEFDLFYDRIIYLNRYLATACKKRQLPVHRIGFKYSSKMDYEDQYHPNYALSILHDDIDDDGDPCTISQFIYPALPIHMFNAHLHAVTTATWKQYIKYHKA